VHARGRRNVAIWPGTSRSFARSLRARTSDYEFSTAQERDEDVDYDGPVVLTCGDDEVTVRALLRGHVNPLDGRYQWRGRVRADATTERFKGPGAPPVTLRIEGRRESAVRISEVDQWGNLRLVGSSAPPCQ
jgi:hypothetical protein